MILEEKELKPEWDLYWLLPPMHGQLDFMHWWNGVAGQLPLLVKACHSIPLHCTHGC